MDFLTNNHHHSTSNTSLLQFNKHLNNQNFSPEHFHSHQQQIMYMNNLLALNPLGHSAAFLTQHFNKEQLTEYQLAKLHFHQQLLNNNLSNLTNTTTNTNNQNNNANTGANNGNETNLLSTFSYAHLPPINLRKNGTSNVNNGYNRFEHRYPYSRDEPKPQQSYIGLIAMAILSMPDEKMVLSDIYQYILDNYPYFRNRGPGWRNSIRHNLSLNDCFVKSGRSANGKGHYWAIHPANLDDFKKGDFRRRKAQRKVRRHMGLSVPDDDDDDDSPIPSPVPIVANKPDVASALISNNSDSTSDRYLPTATNSITPSINATNAFLTQHALNFFNSLRFGLQNYPHNGQHLTETFYKQLIGLDIKSDQLASTKQTPLPSSNHYHNQTLLNLHNQTKKNANTINGRQNSLAQFSIESLLANRVNDTEISSTDLDTKCNSPNSINQYTGNFVAEEYNDNDDEEIEDEDNVEQILMNHHEDNDNLINVNLSIIKSNQPVNLTKIN